MQLKLLHKINFFYTTESKIKKWKKTWTVWYTKRINTEGSSSNNGLIINEYSKENVLVTIYVFISVKEHKLQIHFGPYLNTL